MPISQFSHSSHPQTPENAKALLARGVAALPDSVKLWMQAARLEQSDEAKKRVLLRCALPLARPVLSLLYV